MKAKSFDCVQMKREGGRRVYEALKGKTIEEQAEYWRQRTEQVRASLKSRKNPPRSAVR